MAVPTQNKSSVSKTPADVNSSGVLGNRKNVGLKKIKINLYPRKRAVSAEQTKAKAADATLLRYSDLCKLAKIVSFFLMIAFLIVMLILFRDTVTAENLHYLGRYLDIGSSYSAFTEKYKDITYTADTKNTTAFFRDDVVVCNSISLTVHSSTNQIVFETPLYYSEPTVRCSENRILVYDLGSTSFSLHNAYSTVYSSSTAFPIVTADIADNGNYVLVTQSEQYRSEATVYHADNTPICAVKKDKVITDVSLSTNGEKLLVLSCSVSDGDIFGELLVCSTKTGETLCSVRLNDCLPIDGFLAEDGSFTVVHDEGVSYYDAHGDLTGEYHYASSPNHYAEGDGYLAFASTHYLIGGNSTVVVLDTQGNLLSSCDIDNKIVSLAVTQDAVYILTADTLYRSDFRNGDLQRCATSTSATSILLSPDNGCYLRFDTYADYLDFSDCFSTDSDSDSDY